MKSPWIAVGAVSLLLISCCNKQTSSSAPTAGSTKASESGQPAAPVVPVAPADSTEQRSEEVNKLVDRLQKDLDEKSELNQGEHALTTDEAKALRDMSLDFAKALVEEGVRYVGFLLKEEEIKKYYGESMSSILIGGRTTNIEGARKQMLEWVGKAPCDFGEPALGGVSKSQAKTKVVGSVDIPFKTILYAGTLKIQGVALTESGWKILRFTPALKRK